MDLKDFFFVFTMPDEKQKPRWAPGHKPGTARELTRHSHRARHGTELGVPVGLTESIIFSNRPARLINWPNSAQNDNTFDLKLNGLVRHCMAQLTPLEVVLTDDFMISCRLYQNIFVLFWWVVEVIRGFSLLHEVKHYVCGFLQIGEVILYSVYNVLFLMADEWVTRMNMTLIFTNGKSVMIPINKKDSNLKFSCAYAPNIR